MILGPPTPPKECVNNYGATPVRVSALNFRERATYDPKKYARDMRGICAACTLGSFFVLESRLWEPQALSAKEPMETHGYTGIRLSVTQKFATILFWNVAPLPRKPPTYVGSLPLPPIPLHIFVHVSFVLFSIKQRKAELKLVAVLRI